MKCVICELVSRVKAQLSSASVTAYSATVREIDQILFEHPSHPEEDHNSEDS